MAYKIQDISEAEKALNNIDYKLQNLFSKNIDLKGRRLINVGNSQDAQDYISRSELIKAVKMQSSENEKLRNQIRELRDRVYKLENP